MTVLCGAATNFLQMAVLRCSVAVGEAGGTPPSHALISDYFSPSRRATALSIYGWGIFLGTAIGFIGGGVIADLFDWRVAFYSAGLLGVPVVLLVIFTVQEPPPGGSEAADRGDSPTVMEVVRHLARTPSFLLMLAAAACQAFLGYTVLGWGVTFLRRTFAVTATEAGFQFGLSAGISGAVGITIGGLLADRLSIRDPRWYGWISGVASIAALPFAIAFAWAEEIEGAIAAFSIFYMLNNTYVSILWTLAQNLVAPRMRATASATQLSVLNIVGLGGGPLMAGYVSDVLEPTHGPDALRIALSIAGVVGAVAGLFFFWMTRYLREDLAAVSPGQD
jgi:predicted MFS family arabinose efflux permease